MNKYILLLLIVAFLPACTKMSCTNDRTENDERIVKPQANNSGKNVDKFALLSPGHIQGMGTSTLYTDDEAILLSKRANDFYDSILKGESERPIEISNYFSAIGIDYKKICYLGWRTGNATDWIDYKISPHYEATISYNQLKVNGKFKYSLDIHKKQ